MPIIVFDLFGEHNLRRVVLGEELGTLVSDGPSVATETAG
jgi:uridylate kinase